MRAPVTQQKRQTSKKDEHHALHSTRSTDVLSLVVPVLRSLSESCFALTELIAVNSWTIAAYLYIQYRYMREPIMHMMATSYSNRTKMQAAKKIHTEIISSSNYNIFTNRSMHAYSRSTTCVGIMS
jgi:hypothetical protein